MASSVRNASKGRANLQHLRREHGEVGREAVNQGFQGAMTNYQRIEKESIFGAIETNVGLREHIHMQETKKKIGWGLCANSMSSVWGYLVLVCDLGQED